MMSLGYGVVCVTVKRKVNCGGPQTGRKVGKKSICEGSNFLGGEAVDVA